jgi:hypothetical protein
MAEMKPMGLAAPECTTKPVTVLSQMPLPPEAEEARRQGPEAWREYLNSVTVPPFEGGAICGGGARTPPLPSETTRIRDILGFPLPEEYSNPFIPTPDLIPRGPLPAGVIEELNLPKVLSSGLEQATVLVPMPFRSPQVVQPVQIAGQRSMVTAVEDLLPQFPAFAAAHLSKIRTFAPMTPQSLFQAFLEYQGIPVADHKLQFQEESGSVLVVGPTARVLEALQGKQDGFGPLGK